MSNVFTTLLILAFLLVGLICLQLFLSRRQNRWFGLILPILSFLISLIYVLNVASLQTVSYDAVAWTAIGVFLLTNIPTAVYLVIYFACRETFKRQKEVERMNIQEL